MRSIKNTSMSFGLVNVPVKVYKATEDHDIHFSLFHADCGGAVGQPRTCKECAKVLDPGDVVKGRSTDDGVVYVTDEDLASLQVHLDSIEIVQFCQADEVDPLLYEGSYYLEPTAPAARGYALLRQVLLDTGLVAVARFGLRGRSSLAVIRVIGGSVLALHTLAWADEVRDTTTLARLDAEVSEQELALAHTIVESMVAPFDPAAHTDTYTESLAELVAARAAGEVPAVVTKTAPVDVSDLLAALEASIAKKVAA